MLQLLSLDLAAFAAPGRIAMGDPASVGRRDLPELCVASLSERLRLYVANIYAANMIPEIFLPASSPL